MKIVFRQFPDTPNAFSVMMNKKNNLTFRKFPDDQPKKKVLEIYLLRDYHYISNYNVEILKIKLR